MLGDPDVCGVEDNVNPFGLQDLFDGGGHILVLAGSQSWAPLDDGHPGPEAAVHLRELQRDVAAPDDDEMGWHRIEFEDRHVGEELDIGQSRNVRHHRTPAHIEKDPVGPQELVADPQRVRVLESGMPADERATVHALQPAFDTGAVGQHDFVLARLDFRHVHADRSGSDAVLRPAPGQLRGVRARDKRLGRNASVVDAGAADVLALHYRHSLPGGGQPARQRRAGLAGADDDRVEIRCHREAVAATTANPPKTATASSSSAIGRSLPPIAATSRLRAW